ncbi:MAG: hypothetical protein J07HQW1_02194 [Haloquadratum walsbyi J07HQW1]|uniref:Uncharacterized protein n=1 Tax=Haloquadratum walsbyi J07HQW1 TaxID=1238424 RepID=U1MQ64_9EURY|nr:MAG: hypothetical protein J07HQW1_02194 [Haloquadratum walsbyi J07HQW1]
MGLHVEKNQSLILHNSRRESVCKTAGRPGLRGPPDAVASRTPFQRIVAIQILHIICEATISVLHTTETYH